MILTAARWDVSLWPCVCGELVEIAFTALLCVVFWALRFVGYEYVGVLGMYQRTCLKIWLATSVVLGDMVMALMNRLVHFGYCLTPNNVQGNRSLMHILEVTLSPHAVVCRLRVFFQCQRYLLYSTSKPCCCCTLTTVQQGSRCYLAVWYLC